MPVARRGRTGVLAAAVLLVFATGIEIAARHWFGLGRHVRYQRDPEIEYVPVANQDFVRRGRRIRINRFSQRADEVSPTKTDAREQRVLLLGDSIVFGGTGVDQRATVGARLEAVLAPSTGRPVRVLSVAADSWGPANVAAYLRRFGTFDADRALWVFPSGDWFDAPGDGSQIGRDPDFPVADFHFATIEILTRLIWEPLVTHAGWSARPPVDDTSSVLQLASMEEIVSTLRRTGMPVTLVHWPTQAWLDGRLERGALTSFFDAAEAAGAETVDLTSTLSAWTTDPTAIYRDSVHPTDSGIGWLASQLRTIALGPSAPRP